MRFSSIKLTVTGYIKLKFAKAKASASGSGFLQQCEVYINELQHNKFLQSNPLPFTTFCTVILSLEYGMPTIRTKINHVESRYKLPGPRSELFYARALVR